MRVSEVFWWSWLWFRNRTRQKIQSAAAFTKNGHDHSSRVRWMVDALACLKGVRSLVIDGELVASDGDERPDFYRLHFQRHDRGLCVWAFDLVHHNGRELRELPLFERKARLEKLIIAANAGWLHYSESFDDGLQLLNAAGRMKLEGIVSKRRNAPYRSGKQCGWVKVKSATWREANKERWRLFERSR
jgi:bifunctional non-homologous end joining protein LigD